MTDEAITTSSENTLRHQSARNDYGPSSISHPDPSAVGFIGIGRVEEISGFSKSSIRRMLRAGTFPEPIINSGNVRRWDLAEVLQWRAQFFEQRNKRAA